MIRPSLMFTAVVEPSSASRVLRSTVVATVIAAVLALTPRGSQAQWATTYETFYLQAPHNWVFRDNYQAADRLFNAFDYGHAILYERLWTRPGAPTSGLEDDEYTKLTKRVLVRPPRVPGLMKGKLTILEEDDEHLKDFAEYTP